MQAFSNWIRISNNHTKRGQLIFWISKGFPVSITHKAALLNV